MDILTLQNFEERLPRWDPKGSNQLYAVVDMGSNGIRFSISDLSPPRARLLNCIYRERAGISLFDALNSGVAPGSQTLNFPDMTIQAVSKTLARFRRISDAYGVPPEHILVLATEAMRRAANAAAMLDAIRRAAGIGVYVLAPQVETLFGAVMGSRSAFMDVSRGGIFLDLGGGSVQMTWVDTRLPSYEIAAALAGESMPFGAARLIRVMEEESPEHQALEEDRLRSMMQSAFSKLCEKFSTLKTLKDSKATGDDDGIDVYLCGGGFRGYGNILMHTDAVQPYPIPSIGSYTVPGHVFKRTKEMRKVNQETEGNIYGMSKRRRRQFPAIVTVVDAFINAVSNIRTATFCSGSNRDGVLMMRLPKQIRESNPLEVLAGVSDAEMPITNAILDLLQNSIPKNVDLSKTPTVISLGLGHLFVKHIWDNRGEDDNSNASAALHDAITRDAGTPGLTHLARAVLGLTVYARWGAGLAPIDIQLHQGLRCIVDSANDQANFWAEYIGAIAAVLGILVPVRPKSVEEVRKVVRFDAIQELDKKKDRDRIEFSIYASADVLSTTNPEDLEGPVRDIGKNKLGNKAKRKVSIKVIETDG